MEPTVEGVGEMKEKANKKVKVTERCKGGVGGAIKV